MGHAFKCFAEQKLKWKPDNKAEADNNAELQQVAMGMFVTGISNPSTSTRCMSAEGIGRLAQAVNDPQVSSHKFTFTR